MYSSNLWTLCVIASLLIFLNTLISNGHHFCQFINETNVLRVIYNMMRYIYTFAQKLTANQLNLPHRSKKKQN